MRGAAARRGVGGRRRHGAEGRCGAQGRCGPEGGAGGAAQKCGGTRTRTAAGMHIGVPSVLDICPSGRELLPVTWCGWPVIDGSTSRGCPMSMLGPWGQCALLR
ncbi:hypothetical protein DN402_16110 [Streptomyces sp. SW4]|nr:hypothetical protein DN402_16110 [Streptomyces sp. SW4]